MKNEKPKTVRMEVPAPPQGWVPDGWRKAEQGEKTLEPGGAWIPWSATDTSSSLYLVAVRDEYTYWNPGETKPVHKPQKCKYKVRSSPWYPAIHPLDEWTHNTYRWPTKGNEHVFDDKHHYWFPGEETPKGSMPVGLQFNSLTNPMDNKDGGWCSSKDLDLWKRRRSCNLVFRWPVDQPTLAVDPALVDSIKHWQRVIAGAEGAGGASCALCLEYNACGQCIRCPVKLHTGKRNCKGTPYIEFVSAADRRGDYYWPHDRNSLGEAKRELVFLIGLLPKGTPIPEQPEYPPMKENEPARDYGLYRYRATGATSEPAEDWMDADFWSVYFRKSWVNRGGESDLSVDSLYRLAIPTERAQMKTERTTFAPVDELQLELIYNEFGTPIPVLPDNAQTWRNDTLGWAGFKLNGNTYTKWGFTHENYPDKHPRPHWVSPNGIRATHIVYKRI